MGEEEEEEECHVRMTPRKDWFPFEVWFLIFFLDNSFFKPFPLSRFLDFPLFFQFHFLLLV